METQTHRTDVWTQSGGEGGADGERAGRMRGERGNVRITICETDSGNLLCDSGSSNWGSVAT